MLLPGGNVGKRSLENTGGAERDRTAGLVIANDALSQLSYSPMTSDRHLGIGLVCCQAHVCAAGVLRRRSGLAAQEPSVYMSATNERASVAADRDQWRPA